jgi:integrase
MAVEVRRYKKTKAWEYDIRFEFGGREYRERRKSKFATKEKTRTHAEDRERDMYADAVKAAQTPDVEKGPVPTVEEFKPQYMEYCKKVEKQKPSTLQGKEYAFTAWILPRFGKRHLDKITRKDLNALKGALGHASASHGNNVARVLTNMLKVASEEFELIDALPKYKPFKRVDVERGFYEPTHLARLYNAAADEQLVMVMLGALAGLRAGEIIGLEWADIDWKRNTIYVQRAVWHGIVGLPKHNKLRHVDMPSDLVKVLKAFRHLRGPRVFYDVEGKPLQHREQLSEWLMDIERAAGFEPKGQVHLLRHSYCSNLAAAGVDIRTIMELAGHKSIVTTKRYMHLAPNAARDAVQKLNQRGELGESDSAVLAS